MTQSTAASLVAVCLFVFKNTSHSLSVLSVCPYINPQNQVMCRPQTVMSTVHLVTAAASYSAFC